eukprot:TRINITY_DN205_c0_g2_i1.p4 TRINITY_DN205_c0_g2~~TRINITY_DN205_c0_g2_i1.p4  ORF type:complete len:107 (+),score=40.03 TRINITY_DN205_c0_g2_i1:47-367(+)
MKHIAAVLLLNMAGREITADAVKQVLAAADAEADAERLDALVATVQEKGVGSLLEEGKGKFASISVGGGAAAPAAAAASSAAAPAAAAAKPAEEEEEATDFGMDLF